MKNHYFAFSLIVLVLATSPAFGQNAQQTRVYDAHGNSIGTSVPLGNGSTRFYDSRGNSLGTSTQVGDTTTFYGPGGNVTGKIVGPTFVPTGRAR